jgi:hypothetical protein
VQKEERKKIEKESRKAKSKTEYVHGCKLTTEKKPEAVAVASQEPTYNVKPICIFEDGPLG